MSKKGFLLAEETLKIVIAVICLVFLIGLLGKLYYNYLQDKDLDFAESSLEHLNNEILAGRGEIGSKQVEIYNPKGWFIVFWKDNKPALCSGFDSCICICKGKDTDDCDEKGKCIESDFIIMEPIKIKDPPVFLEINYEEISIRQI